MKRIFLIALGVLAFTLMFSVESENGNLIGSTVFAEIKCPPEVHSICEKDGKLLSDKYYKSDEI